MIYRINNRESIMRITHYDSFLNENEESPKLLQGFVLHLDYFHVGAYYTLPDFLDVVFESEIGDRYEEDEGRLLTEDDLMERIQIYNDSTHWENVIPRLWCGLKLKDTSKERYTSLSVNPYSAVETLDRWFTNSKREMNLHSNGNWETDLSWLARSIENDNELIELYAEKHPEMLKGAMDLLKSDEYDKINALLKYHKIKGLI